MMQHEHNAAPRGSIARRLLAVLAAGFGLLTVFSGGKVLFGPEAARLAAGNYVPFVLWFNFLAGFAYVAASWLIWRGHRIALHVAAAIAVATLVVFAFFGLHIAADGAHETRTIGAMILRSGFWLATAMLLWRWQTGASRRT